MVKRSMSFWVSAHNMWTFFREGINKIHRFPLRVFQSQDIGDLAHQVASNSTHRFFATPPRHTTHDVVRSAIIPVTTNTSYGNCAYATLAEGRGKGCVGTLSGVGGETAEEIGGIQRLIYMNLQYIIFKFTHSFMYLWLCESSCLFVLNLVSVGKDGWMVSRIHTHLMVILASNHWDVIMATKIRAPKALQILGSLVFALKSSIIQGQLILSHAPVLSHIFAPPSPHSFPGASHNDASKRHTSVIDHDKAIIEFFCKFPSYRTYTSGCVSKKNRCKQIIVSKVYCIAV